MNKSRRIRIARIIDKIDELMAAVDELRQEEEDAYENLPDSIRESSRGEDMYDAMDNLENAFGSLEDADNYLNDAMGE